MTGVAVSPDINLLLAFTTGLFGALHCLGMCGGLAGGYFLQRHRPIGLPSQFLYHGGRLLLYTLLGIASALAGRVLVQSGWVGKGQGLVMMAAGLMILLLGLWQLSDWARSGRGDPRLGPCQEVPMLPPGQPRVRSWSWPPLFLGMLNGLMPCGLVFALALKAAATADPGQAARLMLAFGLGTLPMMGTLTSLAAWVEAWSNAGTPSLTRVGASARHRSLAAPILGGLVALMGLWTGYEGLIFFDIMRGLANG